MTGKLGASSALLSTDDQQMTEGGIEAIEVTLADGQSVWIQDGEESCSKKRGEVDEWILRECFKVRGNLKAAEQQNDRIVVSVLSKVVLTMTDTIMVDDMGEEWEDTFEAWVKKWREFALENEVIPNGEY